MTEIVARECDIVCIMGIEESNSERNEPGDASAPISDSAQGPSNSAQGPSDSAPLPDLDRDLGVIEAITMVTRACPNGTVVKAAERALDAIKKDGTDAMKQQAYFVLTAMQGWRGDRAIQIHRSLSQYLENNTADDTNTNTDTNTETKDSA